jgi:outer membrane protein assembly factor BamD (BamD/ComL family)
MDRTDEEKEALYQKAKNHLASKEYKTACECLKQLGNYKDALEILDMYYELCADNLV